MTGLFSGDSLLGNVVIYWRNGLRVISCHRSVHQKFSNIKRTWVVRGIMDVIHVYCFKSVGILQTQIVKNRILSDALLKVKKILLLF